MNFWIEFMIHSANDILSLKKIHFLKVAFQNSGDTV